MTNDEGSINVVLSLSIPPVKRNNNPFANVPDVEDFQRRNIFENCH